MYFIHFINFNRWLSHYIFVDNGFYCFHKINLLTFTFLSPAKGGKSTTILYSYKIPIATQNINA